MDPISTARFFFRKLTRFDSYTNFSQKACCPSWEPSWLDVWDWHLDSAKEKLSCTSKVKKSHSGIYIQEHPILFWRVAIFSKYIVPQHSRERPQIEAVSKKQHTKKEYFYLGIYKAKSALLLLKSLHCSWFILFIFSFSLHFLTPMLAGWHNLCRPVTLYV